MFNITINNKIITVTGDKGTYSHDYNKYSKRTKIYRIFVAQVLRDYGAEHAISALTDVERYYFL